MLGSVGETLAVLMRFPWTLHGEAEMHKEALRPQSEVMPLLKLLPFCNAMQKIPIHLFILQDPGHFLEPSWNLWTEFEVPLALSQKLFMLYTNHLFHSNQWPLNTLSILWEAVYSKDGPDSTLHSIHILDHFHFPSKGRICPFPLILHLQMDIVEEMLLRLGHKNALPPYSLETQPPCDRKAWTKGASEKPVERSHGKEPRPTAHRPGWTVC